MSERALVSSLIEKVGDALNSGNCESMRFCLVVWCDCSDRPMYIGGNDDDTPRVLKMMKLAADGVISVEFETRGTA
jgi:hypothetical protein